MHLRSCASILSLVLLTQVPAAAYELVLPTTSGSVKFAVIGDNGTGERAQYEVGALMADIQTKFPFAFVIMLGDNLYGSQTPRDFVRKFEEPYRQLISRSVRFFAALGNHDRVENRFYRLWNMNGQRYYSWAAGDVRFFVLDSERMDADQLQWLDRELAKSTDRWKIVYLHHPLYSSGDRHGSKRSLRRVLEPVLVRHGVNVVFQGHDHVYERVKPQQGIHYFVQGASGQLRPGNLRRSAITAAGFDRDQSFMAVEVDGDTLHFQAISRLGRTVDAGVLPRQASNEKARLPTREPDPDSAVSQAR
jgi:hypothetical protein